MARYSFQANRTASATLALAAIESPVSNLRRVKLYDMILGSEATPADNAFLYTVGRTTAAAVGSAVTPSPIDLADAISVALAKEAMTTNGTAGVNLMAIPLNQRATFRWVAAPGSELVIPNTTVAGIDVNTPTAGGLVAISGTFLFEE